MSFANVLKLEKISKRYNVSDVFVLNEVSLSVKKSKFVALLGPSGSGKSTLLHICGLLDSPTSGDIYICGKHIENISDEEKTNFRLAKLGFVYQYHHLLQEFSAAENVILPQLIRGISRKIAYEKAVHLLSELGLREKINALPSELSGGQKQRVAIARAVANEPEILLADEPTGNLDKKSSDEIVNLLKTANQKYHQTVILVTHDANIAAQADRIITFEDGKIISDKLQHEAPAPAPAPASAPTPAPAAKPADAEEIAELEEIEREVEAENESSNAA